MVVRVSVLLGLFCSICLSQTVLAASFSATLSHQQVELGKTTTLILQTDQTSLSLRDVDLSPLKHNFVVTPASKVKKQQLQQWHIRLSPRATGKLQLPPLHYGKLSSAPLQLDVMPAHDSQSGHVLTMENNLSLRTAWLHQQVLITLTVVSKDAYVVLETETTELPGGKLQAIPMQSNPLPGGPSKRYRHTIGWIYFPGKVGQQSLDLPAIRYRRDGIDTHRFYLPRQQLIVKPLPVYLPSNYPIGQLSLLTAKLPWLLFTNHLQQLPVTLNARGMLQQYLPNLQHHIQSQDGLQVYPATVDTNQVVDLTGIKIQRHLQIPFKATTSGLYRLDDLRLQYFDPVQGRLQTLVYHWPQMILISPWLLTCAVLLLLFPSGLLIRYLYYLAKIRLRRYHTLQQARQQLLAATTPQDIKTALMLISVAHGGHANTSLHTWHEGKLIDIEPLSHALYGGGDYDLEQLKQVYIAECI